MCLSFSDVFFRLKRCLSFAKASTCIFQYLFHWSLPRRMSNILRVKTRVVRKPCNAQSLHIKIWKCADWQQTCWDVCCDCCVVLFSLTVGLQPQSYWRKTQQRFLVFLSCVSKLVFRLLDSKKKKKETVRELLEGFSSIKREIGSSYLFTIQFVSVFIL